MQPQKNGHTILVGEDEPEVRAYLEMALRCMGYEVEAAEDGEEILSLLRSAQSRVSAVLLDLIMPQRDGLETLQEIRSIDSSLPVIMISGTSSSFNIVNAMKHGATDFLCKPLAHEDLEAALNKALSHWTKAEAAPKASVAAKTRTFLGKDAAVQEIQALVERVGWSEAPVLIQGETGTGKEVFAREMHAHSMRANEIFLKLNCAAVPSELIESELFGYERGAFTGAFQKKAGLFEAANGGTILLDEIGDMDVRLQAKLLHVLQDREFQRIGGKDIIKVDVRVMAATHRDLEKAIADGDFREDLYYRLNVINIQVPALRERKEDIVALAEYMLKRHATPGRPIPAITPNLRSALLSYRWPGNVRELENVMRRFLILQDAEMLARELHAKSIRKVLLNPQAELPAATDLHQPAAPEDSQRPILEQVTKAKDQVETATILAALNSTRWNRKQAAALLKIDYKALLYKMKKLGVEDRVLPAAPPIDATAHIAMAAKSVG
jgi:two-component system response regulator AtoC